MKGRRNIKSIIFFSFDYFVYLFLNTKSNEVSKTCNSKLNIRYFAISSVKVFKFKLQRKRGNHHVFHYCNLHNRNYPRLNHGMIASRYLYPLSTRATEYRAAIAGGLGLTGLDPSCLKI